MSTHVYRNRKFATAIFKISVSLLARQHKQAGGGSGSADRYRETRDGAMLISFVCPIGNTHTEDG